MTPFLGWAMISELGGQKTAASKLRKKSKSLLEDTLKRAHETLACPQLRLQLAVLNAVCYKAGQRMSETDAGAS